MSRTFAQITSLILQMLQDTTPSTYDSAETGYWIEESLKEFATYTPNIVPVIFKIESRTGTDTAGTASSLTDTTEAQFVDTDDSDEKVIHNTTDNTFSVVKTYTSTSVLVLRADIMDDGDTYRIYNKRCTNNQQIYIGDVIDYLWIDSVEYPIGQKRNWEVFGEVLEIDVDVVEDSDSTKTTLGNIDVLIRFAKPHRLCQLIDYVGACTNIEPVDETTLAVKDFTASQIIEEGDEFFIANQRALYTVTTGVTLSNGAGNIDVYPGMEFATVVSDVITFTQSTLKQQHEELFCHLVAARAVLSDNITKIDAINTGGADVWFRYQQWGERKLAETIGKMERLSPPRTKRRYPTA